MGCRVFISYSHDSEAHRERVLDVAQKLRAHGVDAVVDHYVNGHPAEGWQRWMERQLAEARFVLVVFTEVYRRRFDGLEVEDQGYGSSWEAMLTRQELYEARGHNSKFIPVVLKAADRNTISPALRQSTSYLLMDDYQRLLRVLLDQPTVSPAVIGPAWNLDGEPLSDSAMRRLAGSLPLPLAQTLQRSRNAKNGNDAQLSAWYFFEALFALVFQSQVALYRYSGGRSERTDAKIQTLDWTSLGGELELLEHLLKTSPAAGPTATPFGLVGQRFEEERQWMFCGDMLTHFGLSSNRTAPALEIFRALASRGSPADVEGTAEGGLLLTRSVLEMYEFLRPFGDCRLAVGRYEGEYRFLSLYGDGLRLPLTPGVRPEATSRWRDGELWWIGEGAPLSLHPFVVYEQGEPAGERVGFLCKTAGREGRHRLVYLDYASGDYLNRFDAGQELAEYLSGMGSRQISSGEVRSRVVVPDGAGPKPEPVGSPGRWIGDFEILQVLGRGAMGTVYKARQASLGRLAALKVLGSNLADDPTARQRFTLEVEALGRCDHPNVVKVLTAGTDGDTRFFAMELVDGSNLAEIYRVLRDWKQVYRGPLTEGHLSAALAGGGEATAEAVGKWAAGRPYYVRLAEIIATAARGVQHLHDHQVLHRDLKPANLMVTADGTRAVVMDLGLAKTVDQTSIAGSSQIAILGTLRYMAPEQFQRKLVEVTARADVYSLGATLYELACLAPVFDGDTEERLTAQVLFEEPAKPRLQNPEVPAALAIIIERALAKAPQARYRSAAELAEDLESFARDGHTIHARPPTAVQRWRRIVKTHARRFAAGAAATLALLAGLLWWNYTREKTYRYAHYTERRGIPEGRERLGRADIGRRWQHVELKYRRGRLVAMRLLTSTGRLFTALGTEESSNRRFRYREAGTLEAIEELDNNYVIRRVVLVSNDGLIHDYHTKGGLPAKKTVLKPDFTGVTAESAERSYLTYDRNGFPALEKFQTYYGRPKPDKDGSYGRRFEYSPDGLLKRRWNVDEVGAPLEGNNGVFETRFDYDPWGNQTGICYLTATGAPAVSAAGVSCLKLTYDADGNPVELRFLGPDRQPALPTFGCATYRSRYERGFRVEQRCLGTDEKPATGNEGASTARFLLDGLGNVVETRFFGPDDKPTYNSEGVSVFKAAYDNAGNIVHRAFFDVKGHPTVHRDGYHRTEATFEDGRLMKVALFGADGKPVQSASAMPVQKYRYDGSGNVTEIAYFGEGGAPALDAEGVHRTIAVFNDQGRLVKQSFFNAEGPVVTREGHASFARKYNDGGNPVEEQSLGTLGKPVLLPAGYSRRTSAYDSFGQLTEEAYFGVNGEPVLFRNSYHRVLYKRDGQGHITEAAHFAPGGLPATDEDRVHRWMQRFERGRLMQKEVFDRNSKPMLNRIGYHAVRYEYDKWGHIARRSYFGTKGEPVQIGNGFHQVTSRYNSQGNPVELRYFDSNREPCLSSDLAHRLVREYDARGFMTREAFFGIKGEFVVNRAGYHRTVQTLDFRGALTEQRFFGPDGKLVATDGRAVVQIRYDARGNEIEVVYLDAGEHPVRRSTRTNDPSLAAEFKRRIGAAKVRYSYDAWNRRILEEYFGPEGLPTANAFGAAKVKFAYSDAGVRLEQWIGMNGREMRVPRLEPDK